VECAGYKPFETEVTTKVDVYLGDIVLAKSARPYKRNRRKSTKTVNNEKQKEPKPGEINMTQMLKQS